MNDYTGEIAALITAISFAFGSTLFTFAGRKLGSPIVNRTRLIVAFIVIILIHQLTFGRLMPFDAGIEPWFWLSLSGVVGLALGDASLFQAFVMVGPRISMLMMALAPVLSVIMAWIFLGENLNPQQLVGIILTVVGIGWVVLERPSRKARMVSSGSSIAVTSTRDYLIGLLFGFGGAMGQAGGLVLSKIGLAGDFPALSANAIRLLAALLCIWGYAAIRRQIMPGLKALREQPRAFAMISVAALIGPVMGVWLSLIAVQRTPVGIASTLIALTPVFLLPIGAIVFRERITMQAVIGTLIAFGGTALLFL